MNGIDAWDKTNRPHPAVPKITVCSGAGNPISAVRMNSVMAHPAHIGCSSMISLKVPISLTFTSRPYGPRSTRSTYSFGMYDSKPGDIFSVSSDMKDLLLFYYKTSGFVVSRASLGVLYRYSRINSVGIDIPPNTRGPGTISAFV